MCLGADVSRGKDQKPFDGKLDYDYLMWIDSDCLFSPQHFMKLLSHDKDIVSGIYLMEGGEALASVKEWDEEYFVKHKCFQFMNIADLQEKNELIEVSYTGMGFMLIKKGVFESMEYPWFRPIKKHIGDMVDFTMEDVGFCLTAKERGYKVWIDPQVRVGHEKMMVL
jgi:GT2 family glycosyltransferase